MPGAHFFAAMPSVGARCHDQRIRDEARIWRIVYRIDPDGIVIAEVFPKTMPQMPKHVIETCKRRPRQYDELARG